MASTIEDLRTTLQEMADEHPAPAAADLLAELTDARRARRTRRRWGYAAAVAAAAAIGVVAVQGLPDPGALDRAPGGEQDRPASGEWLLTDGAPPPAAAGLALLDSAEVSAGGTVQVPDPEPFNQRQRYIVMWCDEGPAADDPAVRPPSLVLEDSGVAIPCLPRAGGDGSGIPMPLPPAGDAGELAATWQGDVPRDGEAVVAVYEEAARSTYPFPPQPDAPLEPPALPAGAVEVGPETPQAEVRDPEGSTVRQMHVRNVTLGADSLLELWAAGPGVLRVQVDGVWVTDDGDLDAEADWRRQDPELRDLGWQVFTPGQRRTLELPDELLPAARQERTVQIAVQPVMGTQEWQVAVTGTGPAPEAIAPSTDAAGMPEWFGGFRRAATWNVPTDGAFHDLQVPDELTGTEAAWAVACPGALGSIPLASVSVGGDPVQHGLSCGDVDLALLNLTLTRTLDGGMPTTSGPVMASVEGTEGTEVTGVLSAYVPVPYEDFDFAAATPLPQDEDPLTWTFPEGTEVEASVDLEDFVDGRATLTTTDRTVAMRISSEGVGRVRIDGPPGLRSVGIPADGWWSSWTDQAVSQPMLGSLDHALRPGDELEFTVEGYAPGSLRIELLRVAGD